MKNIYLTLLILATCPSFHSQFVIGGKASYERYFGPNLNGGTLHLFGERSFGSYDSFSLRAGIFCRLPMNYSEQYTPMGSYFFFQDPFSEEYIPETMVRTTYNDIGLFAEFKYFFRKMATENSFYVMTKAGVSYSTIKRRATTDVVQQLLISDGLDKSNQLSVCVGPGVGYQFYIGKNSMLFSEVLVVLPFISIDEGEFFASTLNSITSYPPFSVSGNIGFKYFLFN